MEAEPLKNSLHKPRFVIVMKIGFVPETLESSEQLPKSTDTLCHWRFLAEAMVEENILGIGQWCAAFLECLCLCTFSASLGFWASKQMFHIEITLNKYVRHRLRRYSINKEEKRGRVKFIIIGN